MSSTSPDVPKLSDAKMKERENFCYMAKVAEQAERFEDMVVNMKKVVALDSCLTVEERNHLSVAYKNIIGARRASWRIISSMEQKQQGKEKEKEPKDNRLLDYRNAVEKELKEICGDILNLLQKQLLCNPANNGESRVFYLKMMGDYHRYIAEFTVDAARVEASNAANDAYEEAMKSASEELPPTHPIRLGLALNYSVFFYEICNSPDKACKLAKNAFDDAIAELDTLSEESYKDSTLIMQLLRDNLTLWTSDVGAEDKPDAEKVNPEQTEAH